jgi:hypothetical protein
MGRDYTGAHPFLNSANCSGPRIENEINDRVVSGESPAVPFGMFKSRTAE